MPTAKAWTIFISTLPSYTGACTLTPTRWILLQTEPAFPLLKQGYAADMALAQALAPEWETPAGSVTILPDQPWSRRVSGVFGNHLARAEPALAHAVLTRKAQWRLSGQRARPARKPDAVPTNCAASSRAAAGARPPPGSTICRNMSWSVS